MADHPTRDDIDLMDGWFYARDPHPALTWMRANAPVYWDEPNGVWGLTRYEDVMNASKDPQTFSNAQGMRVDAPAVPSMINFDPPFHTRRRNLVNKGFTPRRVAEYEPRVRSVCVELIERARAKGEFDFVRDVAAQLPMIMIGDMLGVAPEDHDTLLRWSDDLILGSSLRSAPEHIEAATRAFIEYGDYNRKVVADRRAKPPQGDLMSTLVHAEIDGEKLDDDALLQESLLILIGGDETTRHVISGGMYQLLRHPEQRRALIDDPKRVPTAVEEMLRWVTPIQNMSRTLARDTTVRGQTLREGEKVLLLYPSANRDEAVFPEPFRFDVAREPNYHIAFGHGTHFCLGNSLARLELRVMFEELNARLPSLVLANDTPPPQRPSNFIVGIEHLPVRVG